MIGRTDLDQDASVAGDDRARERHAGIESGFLEGGVNVGALGGIGLGPEDFLERPPSGRGLEPPDPAHLAARRDDRLDQDPSEPEYGGRLADIRRANRLTRDRRWC